MHARRPARHPLRSEDLSFFHPHTLPDRTACEMAVIPQPPVRAADRDVIPPFRRAVLRIRHDPRLYDRAADDRPDSETAVPDRQTPVPDRHIPGGSADRVKPDEIDPAVERRGTRDGIDPVSVGRGDPEAFFKRHFHVVIPFSHRDHLRAFGVPP